MIIKEIFYHGRVKFFSRKWLIHLKKCILNYSSFSFPGVWHRLNILLVYHYPSIRGFFWWHVRFFCCNNNWSPSWIWELPYIYYNMWPLFRKLVPVALISKYFENRAFLPIATNKHVYPIKSHNL